MYDRTIFFLFSLSFLLYQRYVIVMSDIAIEGKITNRIDDSDQFFPVQVYYKFINNKVNERKREREKQRSLMIIAESVKMCIFVSRIIGCDTFWILNESKSKELS